MSIEALENPGALFFWLCRRGEDQHSWGDGVPMKILYISTSSGSQGGGELAIVSLARAQKEAGHTVLLWVSEHPRMDGIAEKFASFGEVIRSPYVNTYDLPLRSVQAPWRLGTSRRIAREFRRINPDVLHLNKQNLEDGLDLVRACDLSGIPCAGMIHITQSARYLRASMAGLRDWSARRVLRGFGGLWVANPDNRIRELRAFLGAEARLEAVANGVVLPDLEAMRSAGSAKRAELGIPSDTPVVLAVGRVTFQKRPDRFLAAAAEAKRQGRRVRFLWVGSGDGDAEWEATVQREGLSSLVTRIPWQDDVTPFFGLADIFLHPAEFEGLPYAVLEALASGLPVVLSKNLLDDLPSLGRGNCLAMNDPGFSRLLEDPVYREEMSGRARKVAEEQYALPQVALRWMGFYEAERARAAQRAGSPKAAR